MATRRRSTATKSAKTIATPVKKASRKSPTQIKEVVTKYTQPIEIKKVTETPTPVKTAPPQPNLKWEDYRDDIKIRWEIHQYETQELWSDMVKFYQSAKPVVIKTVDYVKDSYDRAFNQEEDKETT
tara:strand:+ start:78 stop:455 length:378 start_codon:yes stop_codon:yes gene_type:complete